eukprot:2357073-Alexandrium_andersonii.AAC.1
MRRWPQANTQVQTSQGLKPRSALRGLNTCSCTNGDDVSLLGLQQAVEAVEALERGAVVELDLGNVLAAVHTQ